MTETERRMILVPADDTRPARPGEAGTPADGEWVWLPSREDWDVGPYEVVAGTARTVTVMAGTPQPGRWLKVTFWGYLPEGAELFATRPMEVLDISGPLQELFGFAGLAHLTVAESREMLPADTGGG